MVLWANDICFIGDEDFMYAESWVTNADNAQDWEYPNDVEIMVYKYLHETGEETAFEGADIYLMGKYVTSTGSDGRICLVRCRRLAQFHQGRGLGNGPGDARC